MSNIEPTEEQRRAAVAYCLGTPTPHYAVHWVKTGENVRTERGFTVSAGPEALARLLAEREAKLREGLARIIEAVHVQMAATALPQPLIDVVRGVYAEHPYALHRIEDLEKVCHALQDERDTLRARVALVCIERDNLEESEAQHLARIAELEEIAADLRGDIESDVEKHQREVAALKAELEAEANDTRQELQMVLDDWNDMVRAIQAPAHGTAIARAKLLVQREAQHLADIKALRRDFAEVLRISDRDHVAWLRVKGTMAATAHYDDAKAAEGGEG